MPLVNLSSLGTMLCTPAWKKRVCLLMACLAVAVKFWLIAESKIIDDNDDPHEYMLQILYAHAGVAYPPGTGWVGRFFYDLGIPFRLGIEAAFIVASALTIKALLASPAKSYFSLGLFIFMIFNPTLTLLFAHLMSDQVWLVETMLGLSFFVLALQSEPLPHPVYAVLSAIFLGLSAVTRSVSVPIALSLIVFIVLALFLLVSKRHHVQFKRTFFEMAFVFGIIVMGIGSFYEETCLYNDKAYGFHGTSVLDSAEYKTFYFTLQAVGASDGASYFPVDENRRKLIAQAGPLSKKFIADIETDDLYKKVGLDTFGKSDFPTGWIHFAIFNTTIAEKGQNLRASFDLFRSIEGEIAEAGRSGRLQVRPLVPLPDRRLHLVLANFPGAIGHGIEQTLFQPTHDFYHWPGEALRYDSAEFDRALHRRPGNPGNGHEAIWRGISLIYREVYTPVTFTLWLAGLMAFVGVVARKWRFIPAFSAVFVARQSFTIFFVIYFLWYAFFDASGLVVVFRYVIYNNVMLVPLMAYYGKTIFRLVREDLAVGAFA